MSRYIDADKLIERLLKLKVVTDDMYGMGIARGIERAETAIETQPTADVVEVRHGYFEHIADFGNGNCFGYCSECHAEHKADNPTALKFAYGYCRWCGAKMDGERSENGKGTDK